ncbi:putative YhdH/YhfP family quinone oxidoreductase [Arcticibacter pallidicorallinus]|uniref:Putative YhdH/YhfP family quinone oxidoreductase n=1 Tax=Arcticibacter pallidicorallinus TaxID=1259464 RepID=A0A2T0U4L2_9SPHI|nr:YhdH/YhfP family quinone oxidoreductase [Arcticibacter pallidicorallinus]PRY52824.1 putative YhdH/YhfP family quinone oxidoreductase [Arcticibacter pallidicorallinus]
MAIIFKALQAVEANGRFDMSVVTRSTNELAEGDVLIKVHYSSLNYKDAMSASGNKSITKYYPHTPGIDVAGIIEESSVADWKVGDEVIVTGFDLGMNTSGGFGGYVRVPAAWIIRLPGGLSLRESMIYGTAGFTAALSVQAILKHGIKPEDGLVAVSGATGGVGSVAVSILNRLGYQVAAISSKDSAHDFLYNIGASEIISRAEMEDTSGRPMLKSRFAAAVDTVGGTVLTTILKSLSYGGILSACGLVNGTDLPLTIFPFIIKGIHLAGIDSVNLPIEHRPQVWESLANDWKPADLAQLVTEVGLQELPRHIEQILKGQMTGRVLVNVWQ